MVFSSKLHRPPTVNHLIVPLLFQHVPRLTMWSACGRSAGKSYGYYDGVICLGQGSAKKEGKVRDKGASTSQATSQSAVILQSSLLPLLSLIFCTFLYCSSVPQSLRTSTDTCLLKLPLLYQYKMKGDCGVSHFGRSV